MRRSRRSRWGRFVLVVALLSFVAGSRPAGAASIDQSLGAARRVADSAFDLVVLRPLSGSAVVVGSVMFVAAAPFVAPFEGLRPAWSAFVVAPYEYAIQRPLGEL